MGRMAGLRNYLRLILRLSLAGVFVVAALPKLQDPVGFAVSITGYRVVGTTTAAWLALILPWLELVCGIGLLIPWLRRGSALILSCLLTLFVGLHLSVVARGLSIDCGCFAFAEATSVHPSIVILRTVLLLIASLYLLWSDGSERGTRP
jgi:uncharacterized membrane protein YphA (DoxX/SURF4 family)